MHKQRRHQRRKALDNLLGCRPEFEMMNDGVQTNSRAFDANRPLLGDNERHDDGSSTATVPDGCF